MHSTIKKLVCVTGVVLASVVPLSEASASTVTGTVAVSLTIQASCVVSSSSGITFGTSGVLTANTDAPGTLGVQCTNSTPYVVALDAGAGTGATTATRKLTSGAATVNYALYRDSGRTLTWGNTSGTDTVAGTGNGAAQTLNIYGRVPTQTTPAPGSYTDTVNVTVTY